MTTRIIVCGAAGRMGRSLIRLAALTPGSCLAGAIEISGHPAVGSDAGILAGIEPLGIPILDSYEAVAESDTVAVDFTTPQSALAHLATAVTRGAGIVIGTTGFSLEEKSRIDALAGRTRCVISPNMSVGIAVLRKLAEQATQALGDGFDVEIVEMHHRMKVDSPSGTALALAETVASARRVDLNTVGVFARHGIVGKRGAGEIGVATLRGGDVVGDHTVIFAGEGERIELTHRAHSRESLAKGAIRAAIWLEERAPGRYDMLDVLGW